jgi:hypothetical protein
MNAESQNDRDCGQANTNGNPHYCYKIPKRAASVDITMRQIRGTSGSFIFPVYVTSSVNSRRREDMVNGEVQWTFILGATVVLLVGTLVAELWMRWRP